MIIYRVTVTAEETAPGSDYDSETLFELAGGAELIGRLAPAAVIEAVAQRTEAVRAGLAERVMDAAAAAGAPVAPASHPFQGEQPARRPRRTKAQIAADTEAQSLGFRDAAHRAEVEATLQRAEATAPGEGSAEATESETSSVAEPAAPDAATVTAAVLAAGDPVAQQSEQANQVPAYNPFQVK